MALRRNVAARRQRENETMPPDRSADLGFAADARRADPLPAAHARVLPGARLRRAVRVGALRRGAVPRRCASRSRRAASRSSPRPRRTSRTRATRDPARRTTPARSSSPSIPATRAATTTTCASRTSRSTASTRRPRTAAPGSRSPALRRAAAAGRIGAIAPRFHGAPTNRSHRTTLEVDGPEIVARCRADGADAAILVANCPVCHQTLALVARLLEESGIATVVMGCAKDIVEHVGVPRFLFSDFPLGNAAGRPHDVASQDATLDSRCALLETAPAARTTVQSPLRWSDERRLEARLLQHRAPHARRDRAPPRRVRRRQGAGEGAARGIVMRPRPARDGSAGRSSLAAGGDRRDRFCSHGDAARDGAPAIRSSRPSASARSRR